MCSLHEMLVAQQAVRGIDLFSAVTPMAGLGCLTRFPGAHDLMGCLGRVAREGSTGDRVERGGIICRALHES